MPKKTNLKIRFILCGILCVLLVCGSSCSEDCKDSNLVIPSNIEDECEYEVKSLGKIGEGAFPRVSPDGNSITFTKEVNSQFEVFGMNMDGTDIKCLTCNKEALKETRNRGQSSWHPSGKYITFTAETTKYPRKGDGTTTRPGIGRNHNIWIMTSDGTFFWQVTDYPDNWGAIEPYFSYGGTMLHWDEEFMMEKYPYGKPSVDKHCGCYWGPGNWMFRKGEELCAWRIKYADIVFDIDGAPVVSNTRTLDPPDNLTLIESNGFIADDTGFTASYVDLREYKTGEAGDIYIHYLNDELERLTKSSQPDEDPVSSPDGKMIAWKYCNKYPCEGDDEIYLMDSHGENKVRLTNFSDPSSDYYDPQAKQNTEISWKPDGSALVFGHVSSNETMGPHIPSDIYVLSFKGNCGNST
ncbi:MAG: hypothetical protein GY865_17445 [candidate division Zixibacteria bacterium]|nr:hypothetical protein [candidate division Zixibacteria bacterium]